MKNTKILTLVGGISQGSLNKKLFHAFKEVVGGDAELIMADIAKLPFFSQDIENDPPDSVIAFKDQIRQADAILFITPEYNHSIPGVLKNAIDWGTRPYPENVWQYLPVATMGASAGNIGTFGAQNHLRQILIYLDVHLLNQPEFYMNGSKAFDENGKLTDEKSRKQMEKLWTAFKGLIGEVHFERPTPFEEVSRMHH
jgi:chromate reductase